MSYCYDMLHEIKRNIGENGDKEYINHINLLKMIKLDIEKEKEKFKERAQGAEFSLFIENIFTLEKSESKTFENMTEPETLVKTALERKTLIERLQKKMSQRLDSINSMLASHALLNLNQHVERTTSNLSTNAVTIINPILDHNTTLAKEDIGKFKNFHVVYNFYNKSTDRGKIKSPKLSNRPTPLKAKKHLGAIRAASKIKRSTGFPQIKQNPILSTIQHEEAVSKAGTTPHHITLKDHAKRRKSIDEAKMSQLLTYESDFEREDSNSKVRLYYIEPNHSPNHKILSDVKTKHLYENTPTASGFQNRESIELSPINIEEKFMVPTISAKQSKNKHKIKDLVDFNIRKMKIMNQTRFKSTSRYKNK